MKKLLKGVELKAQIGERGYRLNPSAQVKEFDAYRSHPHQSGHLILFQHHHRGLAMLLGLTLSLVPKTLD